MEFTWQNGRQLATFKKNNQTTTYTYDADGIRTKKVTPGQQVNYYVANGMLLGESRTTGGTLTYLYDESGVMYGLRSTARTIITCTTGGAT